jgi:2-dehydropantoate 2-reductase
LAVTPRAVFLATKAVHVAGALAELEPHLAPDTAVVVLQNGFCDDEVAARVGRERVVSCTVNWGATLLGHGHSRRTTRGGFTVGRLDGRMDTGDPMLDMVTTMLGACSPVRVTDNIVGSRHAKLVFNACASTPGGIAGVDLRGLLTSRAGREVFLRAATEAVNVFLAMGIRLGRVDALRVTWLHVGRDGYGGRAGVPRLIAELAARVIAWIRGGMVSSVLQSLRRGERTEIDYLNGYIVAKATEVGVPVPVHERLVRAVDEITRGERAIGMPNLAEIVAGVRSARA